MLQLLILAFSININYDPKSYALWADCTTRYHTIKRGCQSTWKNWVTQLIAQHAIRASPIRCTLRRSNEREAERTEKIHGIIYALVISKEEVCITSRDVLRRLTVADWSAWQGLILLSAKNGKENMKISS